MYISYSLLDQIIWDDTASKMYHTHVTYVTDNSD